MPVFMPEGTLTDTLNSMRTVMPEESLGGTGQILTREQYDAMSQRAYNQVNDSNVGVSAWEHVGRWAAGTLIDTADSLWSTPLNPFGDRGDVWSLASPEEQDYYKRNKDLIEGSSAVLGGLGIAVASEALVVPRIASALASSTALQGSALWRATAGWTASSRAGMLTAQRAAAEAGEAFGLFSSQAGRSFLANRMAAGVAATTRTMPIEYTAMWNNEAFNSGEWDREGFWIGAAAALGGTVGAVGARAATRRIANSPEVRDLRWSAMVASGASNDLLSTDYLAMAQRLNTNEMVMKESALATEYFLGSRAANPKGMDEAAENATRLNTYRANLKNLAADTTQKILVKGIPGVNTLKERIKNLPEIEHIVEQTSKVDPFVFHGMDSGGIMVNTMKNTRETRAAYLEQLKSLSDIAAKKGQLKEAQRLNAEQRRLKLQDENVLINGSWMNPDSELAKNVLDFNMDVAKGMVKIADVGVGVKIHLPIAGDLSMDASLTPMRGSRALAVESLGIKDRLHLDQAARKLMEKMTAKGAKEQFALTPKGAKSWYTLDLAAEIKDKGGVINFSADVPKMANVDDMKRESLRLKAKALLGEVGTQGKITPEMRYRYNLPAPTPMERIEDSAGDGFRHWLTLAASDEGTHRELAQGLADYRVIQGIDLLPAGKNNLPRIDGDMLNFNRGKKGDWLRPMLGYFDQQSQIQKISERGHSNAMTLRKAIKTQILMSAGTDEKNLPYVSRLARQIAAEPGLPVAQNPKGLHENQITGTGGGVAQLAGEVLPRRFRYRDNPVLLESTKLQEKVEKAGLSNFKEMMDSVGMQEAVTRITSSGHAKQRAALDQYFSLRSGWDVEDTLPLGDDMHGFVLADTENNRRRLKMSPDDEWDDFTFMPNERMNQKIAVDSDSLKIIQAYNELTDQVRQSDNVLRNAKGLRPIEHRQYYAPPPDTRNAIVAFVFDPNDTLVSGRTIVAKSPEEFRSLQKRTLDDLGHNSGYTIRTKEQIANLRDIWDEAQLDWLDPGVSGATGNIGSQTGGLTGAYTRQGAFMEALDWIKRKSVAQSQDTLRSMFDEQIQVARALGISEATAEGGKIQRNIYHEYEAALMGSSKEYAETSIGDGMIRGVERHIDRVLANSAVTTPARYVVDLAQRVGMDPTDLRGKKTYQQIADAMGPYTPWASSVEYLESRGVKQPPTVKGMARQLNSLAASVMLRWFELPQALMNGLGLIATMPAAVMGGRAPISTFTNVKGEVVPFVDSMKIMSQGMQDMFTKRGHADFKEMVKNGDASQSVLDYHSNLGAVNSQAGLLKWIGKADKWASMASDTSENWSRQVAHFVGLRLADYHGLTTMSERHSFAREIANSMVADYAPINRPELFNSGFGSMFGLFQSYAMNHYGKMFRWMENGEYAKMGIQAALQATMFGMPGTYGVSALMDLRDSWTASGSEPTALDLIYKHYGPVLGGAIAHGSVSQISGLGLWTRGDTSFRVPGMSGPLAPVEIGTKVARGFVDGVSAYLNAMPGEGRHAMMEVVQREMPNRVLKSWLTLAMGGKEIDAYGQVMTETQGWMDTVAKVVGVRSSRQQSELEAYYAGRSSMERDANRMERVREQFRAAVRNNKGNVQDISPIQYFNDYVAAGGNPKGFKTWVKNALRDADSPRSVQSLKSSMNTPRSALETWRYGAYGAWAVQ